MKIVLCTFNLVVILILAEKYIIMKSILILLFCSCFLVSSAQINLLKQTVKQAKKVLPVQKLSEKEIANALKEALTIGGNKASKKASIKGGFYKNHQIKISFPPEAEKMKTTLIKSGMNSQIDDFEKSLNHAAELASKEVQEIIVVAIIDMTVQDAFSILKGNDNAATIYLRQQTEKQLYQRFKPIVKQAIDKVGVTKHWNPLATRYNALPFTKAVNPDLEDYVTQKTIDGLFVLIAQEEKNIRENPKARVSELLQKVFK